MRGYLTDRDFEMFMQGAQAAQLVDLTKSPIEQSFVMHLTVALIDWGKHSVVEITPQAKIEKYIVDFLISCTVEGAQKQLVVECDGLDFHERTKEQAANDKSRDRRLQALGLQVYRFTGSEIFRNPVKCVEEILTVLFGDASA